MKDALKLQYIAAGSLAAVFLINIFTPPDIIIDILYLCSIVLVFKQGTKIIVGFSTAAIVLIIINISFFDQALINTTSLWVNRGTSVFAMGIAAYIAIHYRMQTKARLYKQQQYLKALEEMLFMTSHQVRKPVANILGLIEAINAESVMSPDDLRSLCAHLKSSAKDLDTFIKSLSTFIEETEEAHNSVEASR